MSYYAGTVHLAAYSLLVNYFGPRFKTYRMTPMLQVTPQDLPILAVHILRERRRTDGQANERVPGFKHELTLGYSGAVRADTDDQNHLYQLEQTMSELDDVLFTNPYFVKMLEGFESMDRIAQYSKVGETTLFEIRVECVMGFSSWFDPVIPDWLNRIMITTQFPSAAAAAAGTPQLQNNILVVEGSAADVTPPTIPMGVTPIPTSPTTVLLAWSPSRDDVAVTGYQVWRNAVQIATVTDISFTDSGLMPATRYQYYVTAFDAAGNISGPSPVASVATPASVRENA